MNDIARKLRRAFAARAAICRLALLAVDIAAADGAFFRHIENNFVSAALFLYNRNHLGDYIACFLHNNRVADSYILFADIINIVQRCA